MNRLSTEKRAQVIGCLVEGMSIRATVRVTGAAKNTVTKLLCDLGETCSSTASELLVDLDSTKIQCDEIWSFCYSKQKNVPYGHEGEFGYGDIWTWVGMDADTKLVPAWLVGDRSYYSAKVLIDDLAFRLKNRVQLTTDGHKAYLEAIEDRFGGDIDYAMLIKMYGGAEGDGNERRYSPSPYIGAEMRVITGDPDPLEVSTSYVERQNLTMRMSMRRFTRLTNAFSKKVENLAAAVSLHFFYYNFARPHQTLTKARNGYPTTPAMAAGKADHVWTLAEIAALLN